MNLKIRLSFKKSVVAVALSVGAFAASAAFTITLNFTAGLGAAEQSYFAAAKSFWEGVVTGYKSGISLTGFTINASGVPIDGTNGILGSAGPTLATLQAGFWLTTAGEMQFDSADIPSLIGNGSFGDVIRHEMAHVMGFGTLWTDNGVYIDGSGAFTGAGALATYRTEFNQPGATFVPVELAGGAGTADGHWDEQTNGSSNTGRTDTNGRDMRFELMTGWINTPVFVSRTTVMSFSDIGYSVNVSAIPEPGSWSMLFAGMAALGALARRRQRVLAC